MFDHGRLSGAIAVAVMVTLALAIATPAAADVIIDENFNSASGQGGGVFLTGSGFNWIDNWDDALTGECAFGGTAGYLQVAGISAYGVTSGGVDNSGAGVINVAGATFNLLDESFEAVTGTPGGMFLAGDGTPDTSGYTLNWDDGLTGEAAFAGTVGGAVIEVGGGAAADGLPTGGFGGGGGGRISMSNVTVGTGYWYAGLQWEIGPFPGAAPFYNPGFDDGGGSLDHWGPWGNAYSVPGWDVPVTPLSEPNVLKMWGQFWGTYNESGVWQELPAEAGQVWELSAYTQHVSTDAITGTQNFVAMAIEFYDVSGGLLDSDVVTILDGNSPTDVWLPAGPLQLTAPAATVTVRAVLLFVQPAEGLYEPGAGLIDDVSFEVIGGAPSVNLADYSLTAKVQGSIQGGGEVLGDYQLRMEDSDGNRLVFYGTANGSWQTPGGLLSTATEADANGDPATGVFNVNSPWYRIVVAFDNDASPWGTGGALSVDNLLLTNDNTEGSDWYAGLHWPDLVTTEIEPGKLQVSADVFGDVPGGEYELRVEGMVHVVSSLSEPFTTVNGDGGFFITDADTPDPTNLYASTDDWDSGITGEGAYGGINNGQFLAPGGVSAIGLPSGGTDGTGSGEIRVENASWGPGGGWYAGLYWNEQGLASTDLSQVTLTADIRGSVASYGTLGDFELRIEDAQGDRMYFPATADGSWQSIGGTLDTATEGPAHDGGGDGTFDLNSPSYSVAVSFINEADSWLWGGVLEVDNLYLTPADRPQEIGRMTFHGTADGTGWQTLGGLLSDAETTFPVEGGVFWEDGGEQNEEIPAWDAGIEGEEAFAGFWGNATIGTAAAQGVPGEGVGGGGAGSYSMTNVNAPGGGGWWVGVVWRNQVMEFTDLSQVELTADVKGTWDPGQGQTPGTIYVKVESSPNNMVQFPIVADGTWHSVGGTLDQGDTVGSFVIGVEHSYSVVVSCYGESSAEWGLGGGGTVMIDNLSLKLDGQTMLFEDFDTVIGPTTLLTDVDTYTVAVAFTNPVATWGTDGTLMVDNLRFETIESYGLGDMNCDGIVNAYDIDGFICAVSPACDYEAMYPDCDRMLADCNQDGDVNAYDIDGFIALVGGG